MPECFGQLHLSKACWEVGLSDDQPQSDYNGQWRRTLCMVVVPQSPQPNPQMNEKWQTYVIKQIKICAEYRDMLPRPRLDLSGTSGRRPIGLSPGSWQTSLGLGSMPRYSAQILIFISNLAVTRPHKIWQYSASIGVRPLYSISHNTNAKSLLSRIQMYMETRMQ